MTYKILFFNIVAFSILCSCQPLSKKNAKNINYDSIRIVLEEVHDRDQNIREILIDSVKEGTPEFQECITKMIQIDNENQKILIPILEKYGWISKSKIGEKASKTIFLVVQHSETEVMMKYFPQLDSLSKIGEASRIHAAMMEDRILMDRGQKQIYGTQATTTLSSDGKLVIWPIENPAIVDSLRKEIGFEQTVNENAKRMGATYNSLEKLSKKPLE